MKKSISTFLLLAFFTATYGQETTITIPEITKATYLKKSKKQKTTAWVFLGVGSLSVLFASIEVNPNYGESTNTAFLFIGGLVMVGASVSMFTASARNKKRAASVSFGNQLVPQMNNGVMVNHPVHSFHLKIRL